MDGFFYFFAITLWPFLRFKGQYKCFSRIIHLPTLKAHTHFHFFKFHFRFYWANFTKRLATTPTKVTTKSHSILSTLDWMWGRWLLAISSTFVSRAVSLPSMSILYFPFFIYPLADYLGYVISISNEGRNIHQL